MCFDGPRVRKYDAATASATSMVWRRKVRSSQRTQTTIQSCHVPSVNVTCRLQNIRDVYPGTEESGPKKIRLVVWLQFYPQKVSLAPVAAWIAAPDALPLRPVWYRPLRSALINHVPRTHLCQLQVYFVGVVDYRKRLSRGIFAN